MRFGSTLYGPLTDVKNVRISEYLKSMKFASFGMALHAYTGLSKEFQTRL